MLIHSLYILGISIFISSIVLTYAINNPLTYSGFYTYFYAIVISFVLWTGVMYGQTFAENATDVDILVSMSFISFATALSFLYFYVLILYLLPKGEKGLVFFVWFFLIVNAILIFYNVVIEKLTSKSNFIIKFIFFIPCMITDFLKYLVRDIGLTPYITYYLILLELICILLYFYIPIVLSNPSKRISVLENVVFLNRETTIANSELLHVTNPQNPSNVTSWFKWFGTIPEKDTSPVFNQSYSLSFWAYLNPSGLITDASIFNYGGGKPRLSYTNDAQSGEFVAQFTNINSEEHSFEFPAPLQKWNYFVFSYVNGTCELYLNGVLIHIEYLEGDLPTYSELDTMTIGQSAKTYGAVCNVGYFKDPMPLSTIRTTYNLLSLQNPPIFITTSNDKSQTWYDYLHLNLLLLRDNTVKGTI